MGAASKDLAGRETTPAETSDEAAPTYPLVKTTGPTGPIGSVNPHKARQPWPVERAQRRRRSLKWLAIGSCA